MPLPQEQRYSYADLLEWNDDIRYELYDGQPVAQTSPTDTHQEVSGDIFVQIKNYLMGKKCRVYYSPFDVRLFEQKGDRPEDVDTVLQPDLLIVCDPSKVDRHGVHGAPDMVVEILSESSKRYDRFTKFHLYQRAGVQEYWIVDPVAQTVVVYTMQEGMYDAGEVYSAKLGSPIVPVGVLEDCSVDLTLVFPAES